VSPISHVSAVDHVIRLSSGRRLGYAVYGDPDGVPVLNCHGGLVCRLDAELADGDARELGICVISPDRPGVGLSDRAPGHDTVDWTDDVRELVDQLGLGRFGVMGWSLGAQYALAVAARLSDRVSRTAVIAGCVPLDDPVNRSQLPAADASLARLSVRARPAARAMFATMAGAARHRPRLFAKLSARDVCPADRTVLLAEADWLARAVAEALRDTRGEVDEYRAMVAPWGFSPEEVAGPVDLWQGDDDTIVPAVWAVELRRRLPRADLTRVEGEGHFIAVTHRREVMARLIEPASD
jgi:pimeloyl-ACP methyl ester carboxylesterase